jgi:nucleotide-binding universal stress UspA family protein
MFFLAWPNGQGPAKQTARSGARHHPFGVMPETARAPNVADMSTEQSASPILAAFEAGSARREAIDFACVAARITGAPLVAITVEHAGPVTAQVGHRIDGMPDSADRAVEHLRVELRRRGVQNPDCRMVANRHVGAGLVEAMQELRPRLVVLGSPAEKGAGGKVLGDVVESVIHEAECPVAVVPHGYHAGEGDVRVVGAAFTPTEEGRVALQTGAALARAASAALQVIQARAGSEPGSELHDALAGLGEDLQVETEVSDRDPVDALVEASERVDMLVVGSRARGPRRALLLGSVSRSLCERAACPVLVVPRAAEGSAGALLAAARSHAAT